MLELNQFKRRFVNEIFHVLFSYILFRFLLFAYFELERENLSAKIRFPSAFLIRVISTSQLYNSVFLSKSLLRFFTFFKTIIYLLKSRSDFCICLRMVFNNNSLNSPWNWKFTRGNLTHIKKDHLKCGKNNKEEKWSAMSGMHISAYYVARDKDLSWELEPRQRVCGFHFGFLSYSIHFKENFKILVQNVAVPPLLSSFYYHSPFARENEKKIPLKVLIKRNCLAVLLHLFPL